MIGKRKAMVWKNKSCVVCGEKTEIIFNINYDPVAICERCANQITAQHVKDLIDKNAQEGL